MGREGVTTQRAAHTLTQTEEFQRRPTAYDSIKRASASLDSEKKGWRRRGEKEAADHARSRARSVPSGHTSFSFSLSLSLLPFPSPFIYLSPSLSSSRISLQGTLNIRNDEKPINVKTGGEKKKEVNRFHCCNTTTTYLLDHIVEADSSRVFASYEKAVSCEMTCWSFFLVYTRNKRRIFSTVHKR